MSETTSRYAAGTYADRNTGKACWSCAGLHTGAPGPECTYPDQHPAREDHLTRTQRVALDYMRAHPGRGQWPAGRGRFAVASSDARWSERTLQGLVDAGLARWRGSSHETPHRHGVMPYVELVPSALRTHTA